MRLCTFSEVEFNYKLVRAFANNKAISDQSTLATLDLANVQLLVYELA